MPLTQLLFSFQGRINRIKFWFVPGLSALFFLVAGAVYYATAIGADSKLVANGVLFAVVVLVVWINLACIAKRLHDRGRSGWWMLFYVVPMALGSIAEQLPDIVLYVFVLPIYVVMFWGFIELYFIRGARGSNRYGPDPLDKASWI